MSNHGGKRKGAGRPISTGSSDTPTVSFRLSSADYAKAETLSRFNVNADAKRVYLASLRRRHPPRGESR